MDDKIPESSVATSDHTQLPRERLAPGKVANFPGSLVVNHLGDTLKVAPYPQDKGRLANWITYFREGCDDPAIWKSAVSHLTPSDISTPLKIRHKFVEAFASFLLCYLSGMIDTTISNFGTPQAPAYAGVVNIFLLTLFIMAFAPGSGCQFDQCGFESP